MLNFGQALNELRMGARLRRKGWNSWDIYIKLCTPNESSLINSQYFYKHATDSSYKGKIISHWTPSDEDLLAIDWHVVGE